MTVLNALYSVFSVQRNGRSYGWPMAVGWWKVFILWELSDGFSNPILLTNINTIRVPLVIFHHHILKKVAHSILLNTVDHLSQQLKLYPEHILTGWSQALCPIWKTVPSQELLRGVAHPRSASFSVTASSLLAGLSPQCSTK